jgi:hypothetical protein
MASKLAWIVSIAIPSALAAEGASGQLACGDTIPAGASAVLSANLGPCSLATGGAALTLESGASLDLAGFVVSCDGASAPDGIVLEGKGARLRNGRIIGCVNGVVARGEGRHRVDAVLSRLSSQTGFSLESDRNRLDRSAVLDGTGEGFQVAGSRNRLTHASSKGNWRDGFLITGDSNKLGDAVAIGNGIGGAGGEGGIKVSGEGNRVKQVQTLDNLGDGVQLAAGAQGAKVQWAFSFSNAERDLRDLSDGCGTNVWQNNDFASSRAGAEEDPPCIP